MDEDEEIPATLSTTTYNILLRLFIYLIIYAKVLQFVCVCVSLIQLLCFDLCDAIEAT